MCNRYVCYTDLWNHHYRLFEHNSTVPRYQITRQSRLKMKISNKKYRRNNKRLFNLDKNTRSIVVRTVIQNSKKLSKINLDGQTQIRRVYYFISVTISSFTRKLSNIFIDRKNNESVISLFYSSKSYGLVKYSNKCQWINRVYSNTYSTDLFVFSFLSKDIFCAILKEK